MTGVRRVAPLVVDDFLAWTDKEGYDPAGADARKHIRRGAQPDGPSHPVAAESQRPMLVRVASQVQALLRRRLSLTDKQPLADAVKGKRYASWF
jgi:hypothetical protein